MRKCLLLIIALLTMISCRYDDTDILSQLQDHESRIARLETLANQINSNVTALQTLIDALQNKDYVTSIAPINEGGVEIGYTVTFSKSDPVTIYHGRDGKDGVDGIDGTDGTDGKDGADGSTPVIGVGQDETGIFYWILNGEWLTDDDGNKIPVTGDDGTDGKDGITPQLKIEDDYWYVSYDDGDNWTQAGRATGDAGADGIDGKDGVDGDTIFAEIDSSNADYVVFTLTDGTVIKLPTWKVFEELQTKVNEINTNLIALQAIVEALQNNDYVISITPIIENRVEIGYVINFSKSLPVTIYHGKNGTDGKDGKETTAPVIGVKTDTDGVYYWTLNGEWLLDENGDKIKVTGEDGDAGSDGKVPQLEIKDGCWWVSYDGKDWTNLGMASGVSNLVNIKVEGSLAYLTLDDDVVLTIPVGLVVPEMNMEFGYEYILFTGKAYPISPDYIVGVYMESSKERLMESLSWGLIDVRGVTNEFAQDGSFIVPSGRFTGGEELYYCTFVKANGVFSFGDISSVIFDSNDAEMTYEITEVTENSVTFTGNVQLKYPDDVSVFIGLNDGDWYYSYIIEESISIEDNGNFELSVTGLSSEHIYEYDIAVDFGTGEGYEDRKYFSMSGDGHTFKTLGPYDRQPDLDASAATDLSFEESANSYIVSSQGLYKFQVVKGNDKSMVLTDASCACILWETFGTDESINKCDLIKGVSLTDGYVVFETAETFREGNAVISVKDVEGKILWSWHIWLTDQPVSQTYYIYDYDTESFTSEIAGVMMDRNLGATSSDPGDVGALGLMYQWGRKDPFLGSSALSDYSVAKSTMTWPLPVPSDASNGTIEYTVTHPTTFIVSNYRNGDWYYTGTENTDDTRWTPSGRVKSIYDPCPAGWRVPDGGIEGIWYKSGFDYTDYDHINMGVPVINSDLELWYPAAGYCFDDDGSLTNVGFYGYYWSATPRDRNAYYLYFDLNGDVYPSSSNSRARGYSVRCLQATDEVAEP